jgi:hypothetical protein
VHMVFSTKERHPFLSDPTLRAAMHKHLAAVSEPEKISRFFRS